jgi:hypothetical protein
MKKTNLKTEPQSPEERIKFLITEVTNALAALSYPVKETPFDRIDFIEQADDIRLILDQAVTDAVAIHKAFGNPIAAWQDGKVVMIPPSEIRLTSILK